MLTILFSFSHTQLKTDTLKTYTNKYTHINSQTNKQTHTHTNKHTHTHTHKHKPDHQNIKFFGILSNQRPRPTSACLLSKTNKKTHELVYESHFKSNPMKPKWVPKVSVRSKMHSISNLRLED